MCTHYVYTMLSENTLDVELKEWGNSYGIRIPRKVAKQLGFRKGDTIQVQLKKMQEVDGFGIFEGSEPFE